MRTARPASSVGKAYRRRQFGPGLVAHPQLKTLPALIVLEVSFEISFLVPHLFDLKKTSGVLRTPSVSKARNRADRVHHARPVSEKSRRKCSSRCDKFQCEDAWVILSWRQSQVCGKP